MSAALVIGIPVVLPDTSLPPASAATVDFGGVEVAVKNQQAYSEASYGNGVATFSNSSSRHCTKYAPAQGTFVSNPASAVVAHGEDTSWCPIGGIDLGDQSAVRVAPSNVSQVQDGALFLLATVTHINNPIDGAYAKYYEGDIDVRFPGFNNATITFDWQLAETTNNAPSCEQSPAGPNPVPNYADDSINENGCADWISFVSQVPTQTLTKNGITYKLVVQGFTDPNTGGTCQALDPTQPVTQTFWTKERATTSACVYASFQQVRELTIVKNVVTSDGSVAPVQNFFFSSTSDLNGSAWDDSVWSLNHNGSHSAELLHGESVTVTESVPSGNWTLESVQCVDGAGGILDGQYSVDLDTGKLTFSEVQAPATPGAADITCTFTNKYSPTATLTLVKQVTGEGSAQATDWTLVATGTNEETKISGVTGTPQVTAVSVPAGTYTLSETGGPAGYVPQGWTCVGGAGITQTESAVVLADGANATCTIVNHYQTGNLQITKQVTGPDGGFTSTAAVFTGTYQCGPISGDFTVAANGTFTAPQAIPAGTSCTVTEDNIVGTSDDLTNSSYVWNSTTYPNGQTTTIANDQTAVVDIVNTYMQKTGSFTINKVVTPREGTSSAGYVGGPNRSFDVSYVCKIGDQTVANGNRTISMATPSTISGVPATAVCAVTEAAPTTQTGDFLDGSFVWDGNLISDPVTIVDGQPQTVTVTNYFLKKTADLVIKKVVAGDGYTGGTFTIDWHCTAAENGTVNLAHGESETVVVPANVACTVTEQQPTGNISTGYEWLTPTVSGLTDGYVTVPANDTKTVTVTNTTSPIYGKVTVNKVITGETAGVPANSTFPVTVQCAAADYSATFELVAGGPAQSTGNIPVGTSCTVTEGDLPPLADDSYQWGPKPGPQNVTITEKNQVVSVTVTNPVKRVYAPLAITKVVDGMDGLTGSTTTFSGDWTCTYGGSTVAAGTWSITGAGAASLTATTGSTSTIPVTSSCSATEATPQGAPSAEDASYTWGAASITGPVQLTAEGGTITVTNPIVRTTGAFTVGKTVTGGEAGTAFENTVFTFYYVCKPQSGPQITGTLTALAGGTATLPADVTIPTGSDCTVEETGKANALNPYTWDSVSYSGTGVSTVDGKASFTVADSTVVAVTVTNTLTAKTVNVTVTKKVTGETGGLIEGSEFTIDVICTVPGAAAPSTIGSVSLTDGGSGTVAVPLGSTCEVTETQPGSDSLIDGSYAWGTTTYNPVDAVQILESQTFTVTNPIVRVYGQPLTIQKILTDPTSVVAEDFTFSGTWQCTYGSDDPVTGTWSVDGAGAATIVGFPDGGVLVGSDCTLTEDALTGSPAADGDPSYTWAAPTTTEATVTTSGAHLTVTNAVERSSSSVQIKKVVSGATDGYAGGDATPFAIDYICVFTDGGPELTGTVNLAAGGTATVENVPNGWECSATEQPGSLSQELLANLSFSWGAPTSSAPVTVEVGADAPTITITNVIDREHGTIAIEKAIAANSDAVTSDATFSGGWQCVYGSDEPVTGTWTAAYVDGQLVTTLDPANPKVLVTSECTITENDPTGGLVDDSWTWATPVISGPHTITSPEQTVTGTVTNEPVRVYSEATVTKVFEGNAEAALTPDAVVDGTWICVGPRAEDNVSGTWSLPAAGGTATLFTADGEIQVPVGADCTITETTPNQDQLTDTSFSWNTPTYSPTGGVVTTQLDQVQNVTVTNSVNRVTGELQIAKVIDLPEGVEPATGGTFTGTYLCEHPGDDPQSGAWSLTYPATTTVSGILAESTCQITENAASGQAADADPSYVFTGVYDITPEGIEVIAQDSTEVTVTNYTDRELTDVTITKQLLGDVDGEHTETAFDIDWQCIDASGGEYSGSTTLTADGSYTTERIIPIGSECVVTEGELPNVGPKYTWQPVGFTVGNNADDPIVDVEAQSVTFAVSTGADGAAPLVTVTNSLVRQDAGYYVAKTSDPVSGTEVQPGQTITYTVSVTPTGDGITQDVVVTDDLSQVLPYAELDVDSITASQGAAALDGDTLIWTVGTVSGEEPLTISYEVTVKADMWGATLKNVITATGEEPPTDCPTCPPTTEHPVPEAYTIHKQADPASGSTVDPGQVITYSVIVTNLSVVEPIEGIVIVDDMTEVLNNASFVGVTSGADAASLSGSSLTWNVPQIAADGTQTLTYQVRVNDEAWNVVLTNHITGSQGDNPPTDCPDCETTTTHKTPGPPDKPEPPVKPEPPKPPLASTGVHTDRLSIWMLALLLGGAALLFAGRRRA